MTDPDDTSLCPLCGRAVDTIGVVRTPAFLTVRDPLWRYAGRALHRACFLDWPLRADFVRRFNIVHAGLAVMDADGGVEETTG